MSYREHRRQNAADRDVVDGCDLCAFQFSRGRKIARDVCLAVQDGGLQRDQGLVGEIVVDDARWQEGRVPALQASDYRREQAVEVQSGQRVVQLFPGVAEDAVQFGFRCESIDARVPLLEGFAQYLEIQFQLFGCELCGRLRRKGVCGRGGGRRRRG